MKKKCFIFCFLFFLNLLNAPSSFACNDIDGIDSYFDLRTNASPLLEIEVKRNSTSTNCEFVIGIEKGNRNNGTYNRYLRSWFNQIPIDIRDSTNSFTLQDPPDAVPPANVIVGSFTSPSQGKTQVLKYRYNVGNFSGSEDAGNYRNTWGINLYTRPVGGTNYTKVDSSSIGARLRIRNNLEVSLVPSGSAFNANDAFESLNFGTLTQNATRSCDLLIKGNTDYRITFSSNNGAKLRRVGGGILSTDLISYQISLGANSEFSGAVITNFPFHISPIDPPSSSTALRFPLTVQILDNPATKQAGTYSETITITLTAI